MEHGLVNDIAVCIVVAWLLAVAAQLLRQPLILAYLIAGFVIGEHGLQWVNDHKSVETISSLGLILLLFMIGLEIDLKKMLNVGQVVAVTAATQIVGGCVLGFGFFLLVGMAGGWLDALYLAVAAVLSSTVIIVKILYDKRELDTLPGRITLGVLVVQDLFAILFLAVQPNLDNPAFGPMCAALGKVVLLVAAAFGASRFGLPFLFRSVARLPELVLVGALAWCFALAGLASFLGLSREMGALVAGVAISTFPYTLDVVARATSLRDFFVTLFFVALGMTIPLPTWDALGWMLAVAVFVVGSRLLTVFPPLFWMRYGHRASLLTAVNLCQISELSLVILTLGEKFGHVRHELVGVAAFAFAFLAVDATYAIAQSNVILRKTSPWLTRLGLRDLDQRGEEMAHGERPRRVFLLGFSWTASSLLEEITRRDPALLEELVIVDFNPQVYERLRARGVRVVYGDITQRDTLLHAGIAAAQVIVCSLPNTVLKGATNLKLLQQLRELNRAAQIIVHAELLTDIPALYAAGASFVSVPRLEEARELYAAIEAARKDLLGQMRQEVDDELEDRREVIP
ncbi:MAG TPA: cation:proton antiporter [Verrucomicrobiae bacterium]